MGYISLKAEQRQMDTWTEEALLEGSVDDAAGCAHMRQKEQ
jgi:hypothetical protein